ncbi:MAG: GNAT family N-acetyltransferase [Candidatus Competibacterales bacterium]
MSAATGNPPVVTYSVRPAHPEDFPHLDALYTDNMRVHVERLGTWDPLLFRDVFNLQECEVITSDGEIIGLRKIVRSTKEIYLAELQVGKGYRNFGIGGALLKEVVDEAERTRKRLWLQVIKGNPAENLYRRMGFRPFAEGYAHRKLEYCPLGVEGRRGWLGWWR